MGRQHQGIDRPGVRQVPEGSGEQGKMEKTGCKIICGAPTTLAVKGLMMMMMTTTATTTVLTTTTVAAVANTTPTTACTTVTTPQWGAADAEIKIPSGENTELKRSPFKAWSKSVYSHTYYAYCQGFLSCLFLHFRSIHLHFFQNLSRFFRVLAVANTWFLCRPAE